MSTWSTRLTRRAAVLPLLRRPRMAVLAVRIVAFAVMVPLIMRLPLQRIGTLLTPRPSAAHAHLLPEGELVALVLAMLQAGRPFVRRGCLTRGLTLYYFLARSGMDVALHFGIGAVGPESDVFGDGFDGHCWLVKDGEPFLEPMDPRLQYIETYAFSPRRNDWTPPRTQTSQERVGV